MTKGYIKFARLSLNYFIDRPSPQSTSLKSPVSLPQPSFHPRLLLILDDGVQSIFNRDRGTTNVANQVEMSRLRSEDVFFAPRRPTDFSFSSMISRTTPFRSNAPAARQLTAKTSNFSIVHLAIHVGDGSRPPRNAVAPDSSSGIIRLAR